MKILALVLFVVSICACVDPPSRHMDGHTNVRTGAAICQNCGGGEDTGGGSPYTYEDNAIESGPVAATDPDVQPAIAGLGVSSRIKAVCGRLRDPYGTVSIVCCTYNDHTSVQACCGFSTAQSPGGPPPGGITCSYATVDRAPDWFVLGSGVAP